MARDIYVNGPCLVLVKGRSDSGIGSIQELGLSEQPIQITKNYKHAQVTADAWGGQEPFEEQFNLMNCVITMGLIQFDPSILAICESESMAGAAADGTMPIAGARMANNLARFAAGGAAGNHYIGLNLTAPVNGIPYRFFTARLHGTPVVLPVGTQKSVAQLTWIALPIPANGDPYGAGQSSLGTKVYDHTLDS